jgi:hypothetical protein
MRATQAKALSSQQLPTLPWVMSSGEAPSAEQGGGRGCA